MAFRVIDNFLDQNYLDELKELVIDSKAFPWYFKPSLNNRDDGDHNYGYFDHLIYEHDPRSSHYSTFLMLYDELNIFSLLRIKANLYTATETLIHHTDHVDYPEVHTGAILSLNTCDGGTVLEDGTFIDSIENRLLIFDAYRPHHSTNCTNAKGRWNININYIPKVVDW